MLEVFIQSLLIGYSGAIMPGSLLTFTIDQSLKRGAKGAMLVPLGHVLLEFVLVIAIFLGFGKYLSSTPLQITIGLLGGLLLIYLGLGMIREGLGRKLDLAPAADDHPVRGGLLISGVVLSVSNPYFLIWWTAVGLGLIISAYNLFGFVGIILFYLGHISADLTWYGFVSTLVSKTRNLFSEKAYCMLVIVLGVLLIIFGGGFLLNSVREIIAL